LVGLTTPAASRESRIRIAGEGAPTAFWVNGPKVKNTGTAPTADVCEGSPSPNGDHPRESPVRRTQIRQKSVCVPAGFWARTTTCAFTLEGKRFETETRPSSKESPNQAGVRGLASAETPVPRRSCPAFVCWARGAPPGASPKSSTAPASGPHVIVRLNVPLAVGEGLATRRR
jgi:hypothetical protein